jgi:phosphoadenosine phosphosulfate reductase
MLISETLFGTRDKIQEAIDLLRKHEPPEGYFLAYSGGKDSDCILALAKESGVKYEAHYNLTTVDPPELVRHVKQIPTVKIDRPKYTMWSLIRTRGPMSRIYRDCCRTLKERGGEGRIVITGIRAEESNRRANRKEVEDSTGRIKKSFVHPIFRWTEGEVWEYLQSRSIPYCSLYDDPGWSRIGCLMCPMSGKLKRRADAERYPKIYGAYLRALGRYVERRKDQGKPSRWKSGQEVMDWWLSQ